MSGYSLMCYLWFYVIFFFFFQAEDGIRDKLVTGVQTCALPICSPGGSPPSGRSGWSGTGRAARTLPPPERERRAGRGPRPPAPEPVARTADPDRQARLNTSHVASRTLPVPHFTITTPFMKGWGVQ